MMEITNLPFFLNTLRSISMLWRQSFFRLFIILLAIQNAAN